jgi:tetratricopeptide (TPR) repeat protein
MVSANPGAVKAYWRRAEYRRDQGAFAEAASDCDTAAKLDPKSAVPGLLRASITAAQGRPEQAVAEAERLLKAAPEGDGHVLWAAASVWCLAARAADESNSSEAKEEAKALADRAASLLVKALTDGFHDLTYQEQNRVADDPVLKPILSNPKLAELLRPRGE